MNASGPEHPADDTPRPDSGGSPDPASPDVAPARKPSPSTPQEPPRAASGVREAAQELLAAMERLEDVVKDIERHLGASSREQQHREFSFAWLIGALLQPLVVGFLIAALADWIFRADPAVPLVKLAFAGVLQLGALTAFLMARK